MRSSRHPGEGDEQLLGQLLGRGTRHLAKTIIREILGLPFLEGLQHEAGNQFGLVAVGIIGRWSASSSARAVRLNPSSARFDAE